MDSVSAQTHAETTLQEQEQLLVRPTDGNQRVASGERAYLAAHQQRRDQVQLHVAEQRDARELLPGHRRRRGQGR